MFPARPAFPVPVPVPVLGPMTRAKPRVIDLAPLNAILKMAGPAQADVLIRTFRDDLQATEIGLDQAWNGPDCAALRRHSHILTALAGTVGDTDLQAAADILNAVAHSQDEKAILAMKAQIMQGLADLTGLLAKHLPLQE